MDDLEDHFGRLAAITSILRKFCAASRFFLASILHRITPRSRSLGVVAIQRGGPSGLRPKNARETRETQSIVTVESQLGVSGADSTSCSSSRPPY
jgi:hypothetical protein